MTCRDVIEVVADYLDDLLGLDAVSALERHLAGCEPCRAYLATYRKARAVGAGAALVEMPDDMKERLRRLLMEKLRQP